MKKRLVVVLLLLMVGSTSMAFAWWDSLDGFEFDQEITIGVGERLEVEASSATLGTLVPAGTKAAAEEGFVTSIQLSYLVNVTSSFDTNTLIIDLSSSTLDDETIAGIELYGALVIELLVNDVPITLEDYAASVIVGEEATVVLNISLVPQDSDVFTDEEEAALAYALFSESALVIRTAFSLE